MGRGAKLHRLAELRREQAVLEGELGLAARVDPGGALEGEAIEILDEYPGGFLSIHAASGDYQFASASVTAMFGWSPEQLVGTSAYDYFHETDLARIASSHASHSAPEVEDRIDRVRYRFRCADGDYRWVETLSRARLDGGNVTHIVCVTRDVDDEERARERARVAEDELVRSYHDRFAQQLAGSLAHELSNPLTAALAAVELARHAEAESLDSIEMALFRIRDVLRELSMLAAMSNRVAEVEVDATVLRVLELAEATRYQPVVEVSAARLSAPQASLYHLVYAMLYLHTRCAPGDEHRLEVRCGPVDGAVRIAMRSSTTALEQHARADLLAALRGTPARSPDIPLRLAQSICELDLGGTWTAQMDSGTPRTSALLRSRG